MYTRVHIYFLSLSSKAVGMNDNFGLPPSHLLFPNYFLNLSSPIPILSYHLSLFLSFLKSQSHFVAHIDLELSQ